MNETRPNVGLEEICMTLLYASMFTIPRSIFTYLVLWKRGVPHRIPNWLILLHSFLYSVMEVYGYVTKIFMAPIFIIFLICHWFYTLALICENHPPLREPHGVSVVGRWR